MKIDLKIKTLGQIYKNNFVPDKTAIMFKDKCISYAELDRNVIAYANFFKSNGVKPGNKVLLVSANSPDFLYSYLGVVRNAAVIVPLNPMLTIRELSYMTADSEATFMIISQATMDMHGFTRRQLSDELGVKVFVLADAMKEALKTVPTEDFDLVTDDSTISTFLYTSGTTGQPKAAMLSHYNLMINALQTGEAFEVVNDDIYICVLPMFHVLAFTCVTLMPLATGGTIDIVESFRPKEFIDDLITKKITIFIGVPAMYVVLIGAGKKNIEFPDLRTVISGGAPLPVEVIKQVTESLNLYVTEGYGLTEASPAAIFNPPSGVKKAGSVGLPFPLVECKVVDDAGNELPPETPGELILRGPNVMQGYYNKPEETASTLKDGWLHTGDIAKTDDDGYFYIVDRIKDLIIVSGLNVYPREVEDVLYQHPKVKEAAVIGIPKDIRGESVLAYISLKDGEEVHHKEVIRFLKTRLAQYKIPRKIVVLDDLPKNVSGKILKRELRELALQE